MYRKQTCGELRIEHVGQEVTLAGWVQRVRKMGGMTFVDLRDRYGITQLVFEQTEGNEELCEKANHLGREFVIQAIGKVSERQSKNKNIPTGDIEIIVSELNIISTSEVPPFTIEDKTDGGDDLRMLSVTVFPVVHFSFLHKFEDVVELCTSGLLDRVPVERNDAVREIICIETVFISSECPSCDTFDRLSDFLSNF